VLTQQLGEKAISLGAIRICRDRRAEIVLGILMPVFLDRGLCGAQTTAQGLWLGPRDVMKAVECPGPIAMMEQQNAKPLPGCRIVRGERQGGAEGHDRLVQAAEMFQRQAEMIAMPGVSGIELARPVEAGGGRLRPPGVEQHETECGVRWRVQLLPADQLGGGSFRFEKSPGITQAGDACAFRNGARHGPFRRRYGRATLLELAAAAAWTGIVAAGFAGAVRTGN
jgi:hypothetical protein